ncbi:MAG: hypothetical protein RBU21_17035, partial [FCB group bacterium]|nr:hypothetical protein [FCB group bacterium]
MQDSEGVFANVCVGALLLVLILFLSLIAPIGLAFCAVLILSGAIRFWRAKEGSYRQTEAMMLLIVGCLGVFTVLALKPNYHPPREAMARKHCQENLQAINRALDMYAKANNGFRPEHVSALYPKYFGQPDLKLFLCPNSKSSIGSPERIGEWSSYECNSSAEEWVCREKNNEFHVPGGRNVLRPGEIIEFVKTNGRSCWENLHRISRALDAYAAANGDVRPEHLSALYPDYVPQKDLLLFVCPQDKGWAGPPEDIDE